MTLHQLETHRRTVATPNGPISYLDVGEGPVALFVHGVGVNALLWRHVIDALAGERRCVAVDLPLHGRTPAAPGQDFSLTSLAAVIEDFCVAADLPAVDLVAHDTGGAIGQIFAATHPERLRTVCLTNCDAHDNVPPEAFKPTVELAASGALSAGASALLEDLEGARELVYASGYQDVGRLPLAVVEAYLRPLLGTPEQARGFERLLVSLRPDDLLAVEPALARLTVPTLIVWGTDDVFFELSWAYWLRDLIPGAADVVEIPGGRLFFPDERAADLVGPLRQHWARHAASLA